MNDYQERKLTDKYGPMPEGEIMADSPYAEGQETYKHVNMTDMQFTTLLTFVANRSKEIGSWEVEYPEKPGSDMKASFRNQFHWIINSSGASEFVPAGLSPLFFRGAPAQTASLQEWQDSAGPSTDPGEAQYSKGGFLMPARSEPAGQLADDVLAELQRAIEKFGPMASAHEGWAVLQEEVDELWDEVKGAARPDRMRDEAVQVAAMAMRFVLDVVPQFDALSKGDG